MTRARLLIVAATLAATAFLSASSSHGDAAPAGKKDRHQPRIAPPAVVDQQEAEETRSRFSGGNVISYRPLKGDL